MKNISSNVSDINIVKYLRIAILNTLFFWFPIDRKFWREYIGTFSKLEYFLSPEAPNDLDQITCLSEVRQRGDTRQAYVCCQNCSGFANRFMYFGTSSLILKTNVTLWKTLSN